MSIQQNSSKIRFECVYPNNLRYLWRIVDYLQRDAASKGVRNPKNGEFGSFWNNLNHITEDKGRVFIALNSRNQLVGYMVADEYLTIEEFAQKECSGDLYLEIMEVLPRYRRKGIGRHMVQWLKEKASAKGFSSISVLPAIKARVSGRHWDLSRLEGRDHLDYFLQLLKQVSVIK